MSKETIIIEEVFNSLKEGETAVVIQEHEDITKTISFILVIGDEKINFAWDFNKQTLSNLKIAIDLCIKDKSNNRAFCSKDVTITLAGGKSKGFLLMINNKTWAITLAEFVSLNDVVNRY